jgi:hypothetical protein
VWLAGCVVALEYFALFYVPLLVSVLQWTVTGLTGGVHGRFWWSLIGSALLYVPFLAAAGLAVRERLSGRASQ